MRIVISSGHGKLVRGAKGVLDEVDEARRVVNRLGQMMAEIGVEVKTFHDDTSTTQSQNLHTIVNYHNAQERDLDVSVHFNANQPTSKPMGCECLYLTQFSLAVNVSAAIAKAAAWPDRGAKKRTDLYFLNHTSKPAILIEVCFVDSSSDADVYKKRFEAICASITALARPKVPQDIPWNQQEITASVFGGPDDYNTSAYDSGLVLNDTDLYVALPDRFEGERPKVKVYNRLTGQSSVGEILDVGPWNTDDPYWAKGKRPQAESGTDMSGRTTNKAGIDLSPALSEALGIDGMGKVDWEFV